MEKKGKKARREYLRKRYKEIYRERYLNSAKRYIMLVRTAVKRFIREAERLEQSLQRRIETTENRIKRKAATIQWRKEHPEVAKQKSREYCHKRYIENKEEILRKCRAYWKDHPDKMLAHNLKWIS